MQTELGANKFVYIHIISSRGNSGCSSKRCSWFQQWWRLYTTFIKLEPFRSFSLGHHARTCVCFVKLTVCKLTSTRESNKTKMEWDRRPNYEEGYVVVEKRLAADIKQDGDQFRTSSVESLLRLLRLNTLWFFAERCNFIAMSGYCHNMSSVVCLSVCMSSLSDTSISWQNGEVKITSL